MDFKISLPSDLPGINQGVAHDPVQVSHPAPLDSMAISLQLKACAEESQRDLLLPRVRRLTGERSAFSPTLDWAGMRGPMGF